MYERIWLHFCIFLSKSSSSDIFHYRLDLLFNAEFILLRAMTRINREIRHKNSSVANQESNFRGSERDTLWHSVTIVSSRFRSYILNNIRHDEYVCLAATVKSASIPSRTNPAREKQEGKGKNSFRKRVYLVKILVANSIKPESWDYPYDRENFPPNAESFMKTELIPHRL